MSCLLDDINQIVLTRLIQGLVSGGIYRRVGGVQVVPNTFRGVGSPSTHREDVGAVPADLQVSFLQEHA